MIILNVGAAPVRVAGRWLQPGEAMPVENLEVAYRLLAANPDVIEAGAEPEKPTEPPTEDLPVVTSSIGADLIFVPMVSDHDEQTVTTLGKPTKRKR